MLLFEGMKYEKSEDLRNTDSSVYMRSELEKLEKIKPENKVFT